jgi:hypothetical protein
MSLSDMSLLEGATITPSGGTALVFDSMGTSEYKNTLFVPADTDLRTQRRIVCTAKWPKVQSSAPNGYTQARANAVIKIPLELDNGAITYNTIVIGFNTDVETSSAEKDAMLLLGAQVFTDSDFTGFLKNLSVK